jgi:hypothetical protein
MIRGIHITTAAEPQAKGRSCSISNMAIGQKSPNHWKMFSCSVEDCVADFFWLSPLFTL